LLITQSSRPIDVAVLVWQGKMHFFGNQIAAQFKFKLLKF